MKDGESYLIEWVLFSENTPSNKKVSAKKWGQRESHSIECALFSENSPCEEKGASKSSEALGSDGEGGAKSGSGGGSNKHLTADNSQLAQPLTFAAVFAVYFSTFKRDVCP